MQDALTSLRLSGVDATFASIQPPIARICCHPIQEFNISCYRSVSCKESHVIPFCPVSSCKISAQFQRWISAAKFLSNFAPIWVRSLPNLRDSVPRCKMHFSFVTAKLLQHKHLSGGATHENLRGAKAVMILWWLLNISARASVAYQMDEK